MRRWKLRCSSSRLVRHRDIERGMLPMAHSAGGDRVGSMVWGVRCDRRFLWIREKGLWTGMRSRRLGRVHETAVAGAMCDMVYGRRDRTCSISSRHARAGVGMCGTQSAAG